MAILETAYELLEEVAGLVFCQEATLAQEVKELTTRRVLHHDG